MDSLILSFNCLMIKNTRISFQHLSKSFFVSFQGPSLTPKKIFLVDFSKEHLELRALLHYSPSSSLSRSLYKYIQYFSSLKI